MKRDLLSSLQHWKNDPKRKPLIIRGARQVGKTWLIEHFGKTEFDCFFSINFEFSPHFKSCFEIPDPEQIISRIELTANTRLSGEKCLLFLDEVQECPPALVSLRYFHEKKPGLCVIAAGSLLEFMHKGEDISIPVGRVVNYFLSPLSFGEFLDANNEERMREYLRNLSVGDSIPESINVRCTTLFRTYLYTGGMPASVTDRIERGNFFETDLLNRSLLQNYRQDFGKYGKRINNVMLEKVFMKIPGLVGANVKYAAIDKETNSRDVKNALELLEKARIALRIRATSGAGLPLTAYADDTKIKLLFLDVGLLQNAMGISRETYLAADLCAGYRGAVTEQFIGQQILALKKPYEDPELYYWRRDARGSEAEVDFLYQYGEKILPIEVKSGKTGSLKSLRLFLKEYGTPFGIRFSQQPLSFTDRVLSIPLYAVEALPKLVGELLGAANMS